MSSFPGDVRITDATRADPEPLVLDGALLEVWEELGYVRVVTHTDGRQEVTPTARGYAALEQRRRQRERAA